MKKGIKGFNKKLINKGFLGNRANSNPVTPMNGLQKTLCLSGLWSLLFCKILKRCQTGYQIQTTVLF